MEEIGFAGRVAVVTGAGNGLGRAHALELARRGATVVVNDLGSWVDGSGSSRSAADDVVAEISAAGGTAIASYDDVADPDGGTRITELAVEAFGRLDVVVNNAGILRNQSFADMERDDLLGVLGTHLLGSFYVSQPAFRVMRAQGYGRFVFTSSGSGLFGARNQANYVAAKAAIAGLSRAVAIEGRADGILSNTVAPTAVTRITAGMREGDVTDEDVAHMASGDPSLELPMAPEYVTPLVVYLASERCRVSQMAFSASGGRYAHVFTGVTRGWYGPADAPASPEQVDARLDEILGRETYAVPDSVFEEFRWIRQWHPTSEGSTRDP